MARVSWSPRARWAGIGLSIVVLASWWTRIPAAGGTPPGNDVELYFLPVYEATYRRIAAGALPLWNPYQLCGVPWLATLQGGVFHPLHALYLALPSHVALAAAHATLFVVVTSFTLAFARRVGLSPAAGLLVAALFTLRGMFALSPAATPYFEAAAMTPVGALGVWLLGGGTPLAGAALLAAATALSLLAGYPQPTAYMLCGWAALLPAALVAQDVPPRRWPARAAACLAAVALGGAAAGIQLAPALELFVDGAHRDLSPEAMAPFGAVSPALFTLAYGAIAGGWFAWGAPALALAAAAPMGRRHRALAWWAAVVTVLTVVVSLGNRTPFFDLYRAIPLLGSFRFPDRALGFTDFAVAVAAGIGLDAVVDRQAAPTDRRPLRAGTAALVAIALIVVLAWLGHAPAERRTIATAFALGAAGAVVLWWKRRPRGGGLVASAIVALVLLELLTTPWTHLLTYSPHLAGRYDRFASEYRAVAALAGSERAWFLNGLGWLTPEQAHKLATRFGVRVLDDYEPLAPRRQSEYLTYLSEGSAAYRRPPWLFKGGVESLDAPPGVAPVATRRRLLDLAGVRVIAVPPGGRAVEKGLVAFVRDAGLVARQAAGEFALYENPAVVPRAYVVYRTRRAPARDALLAALSRADFDPLAESYVDDDVAVVSDPAAPPRGSAARIVRDGETEVEVDAILTAPGLVVLADAYYPGWRATVDGAHAPIVATNHLFRGVPVPAGAHRVRFAYRPASVAAGAAASIGGWLGIAALTVAWRRVRARAGVMPSTRC
jgi:hypothetical protein